VLHDELLASNVICSGIDIYSHWWLYPRARQHASFYYQLSKMPRTQESVKIAAVQAAPVSFDLPKSLAKVARFTAEAAKAGADLVVFP